ncbi:alcohol dehydrogenase GroES-like domain-containing protein [Dactylonectria estremocensis]|uniref:Alcohol dehydrogenase GroES-like domain-containing protein n=1 Tax=Dactylonectria estremocensis TaxID=1079267 RepID=A0A9P9F1L2_9HYPO|nr:alcohol dehydrogenase GroES-like domain-containing protein [Dactylonectria estremocensis]
MPSHEQIPRLMKAAQILEYNEPYELVSVEVPKIRDHELLIKVHAAGFCHSDLQVLHGQFPCTLPMIPSHEPAGVIAQVGSQCDGSWSEGDRVGALNFKNACSQCTGCVLALRRHNKLDPRLCERREMAGFKDDGCFAEYMVIDPATTVLLPDTLPFEQAAPLMCAGATVWGALEKATATLEPGAAVGIIGIGGLGHLGMHPPGLSPDLIVDSTSTSAAAAQVLEFTKGEGIAATVVCTDSLDVNAWALTLLRFGGVMVALGLPPEQWRFDASLMVFRELVIMGSYVANTDSVKRMMEVVERAGVKSHVTRVAFNDIPGIVEAHQDGAFKGRLVVQVAE